MSRQRRKKIVNFLRTRSHRLERRRVKHDLQERKQPERRSLAWYWSRW